MTTVICATCGEEHATGDLAHTCPSYAELVLRNKELEERAAKRQQSETDAWTEVRRIKHLLRLETAALELAVAPMAADFARARARAQEQKDVDATLARTP